MDLGEFDENASVTTQNPETFSMNDILVRSCATNAPLANDAFASQGMRFRIVGLPNRY